MKKIRYAILGICTILSSQLFAVSMNFSGHFRSEAAYYNRLNLGVGGIDETKSFISGRALLNPNLVIDDHFILRSQWSLLASPNKTPAANEPLRNGQGGFIFGDEESVSLILSRVWLEWSSDFGVLRVGRMPVSWGYGLLWDSGNLLWDDYQTTYDRLEYRLHLGNVIGGLAYSKPKKGSVLGNKNDSEFYSIYLQYNNPELEVQGGIIYEKQVRSNSQQADLLNENPSTYNSAKVLGTKLGQRTPHPLNSNVVDVYLKKSIKYLTFGGEIAWLTGSAADYNANGESDDLNAFGVLLSTSYQWHKFNLFLEALYASGDSNLNSNSLGGFVLLNRNRRPGLILGRELLGDQYGENVGQGSLVAYSAPDVYSGVYYFRPGFRIDWSQAWSSGIELIMAYKAAAAAGGKKHLGTEIDISTEYGVYRNCNLGINFGIMFPGKGLRTPGGPTAMALRTTFGVLF